jgi:endonuclease YncB( thermonuclease family)
VRRPLLLVLLAGILLAALPAAADAARGACVAGVSGRTCDVWTAKVRSVNDGDTMDVDVLGDGTTASRRIRMTGIQAMEQTVYAARRRQGDCHAVEATERLERLVRRSKGKVRLAADDPLSMSQHRFVRTVAVKSRGRWRDAGTFLMREGLALWWPTWTESSVNATYSVLLQRAIAAQRGLFDPDGCGVGPSAASPLKLWVNWDADGDDHEDVNGEWVKIRNQDPVNPLPLGGWYLRDASLNRFTFPAGSGIPPGGTVTLYVGQGGSFGDEYFWGLPAPAFGNVTHDDRANGDGAYLFDPQGDIRAWMIYPCRVNCADPSQGQLQVDLYGRGREAILIKNNATWPIDLEQYTLKSRPFSYAFPPGSVLHPGETMRVYTEGDPDEDTQFEKHWGMTGPILDNGGDSATLATYTDVQVACGAYGSRSC